MKRVTKIDERKQVATQKIIKNISSSSNAVSAIKKTKNGLL